MKKTNIGYHEKILENPPIAFKKWFDAEKKHLISKIKTNSSVLAIGFGDGREIKYILPKTRNIVGIDHNKDAVKKAKLFFKAYPTIKIILADAVKLPFDNNLFDYVLCIGTFTNLGKNKIRVLKEMKRVCKKKGIIIISMYSEDALPERLNIYKEIGVPVKKIIGTTAYLNYKLSDNISEQFSRNQLVGFFKKAGLRILNIEKVGIGYICTLSKNHNL